MLDQVRFQIIENEARSSESAHTETGDRQAGVSYWELVETLQNPCENVNLIKADTLLFLGECLSQPSKNETTIASKKVRVIPSSLAIE